MSSKFLFLQSMDILATIPQYHTLIGVFIGLWLVWTIAKRRNGRSQVQPTEQEVERKLAEWHPEPMVPDVPEGHPSLRPRRVESRIGKRIVVDGRDCLNLGTHNYLGFLERSEIEEKAAAAVGRYGVGSCGPRGFYGTVDVHLELEERLAKFMEAEEAVVYSYGFSTVASAIPAYCKRRDVVFVDERVNFAIQKGLDASRTQPKYFKHNDVRDLKRLLDIQAKADAKNPKKAAKTRRFLIVEGIYMNTGLVCPLPELVQLCRKYTLRIFIDESISFGTLGANGRGVTEHFGVPGHEVDMIMGSLEWAVGSVGGFCVGSSFVIEHQRLSGLGYCFSASLPPLLASAATKALDLMETQPEVFKSLEKNCRIIDDGLRRMKFFEVSGIPQSPVKHLYLTKKFEESRESKILNEISEKCIENNLAIITAAYLDAERVMPRPSLRICVSAVLNDEDIDFSMKTLKRCAEQILESVN